MNEVEEKLKWKFIDRLVSQGENINVIARWKDYANWLRRKVLTPDDYEFYLAFMALEHKADDESVMLLERFVKICNELELKFEIILDNPNFEEYEKEMDIIYGKKEI